MSAVVAGIGFVYKESYLAMTTSNDNRQFYFQFHITHACNLRCKHCYQDEYTATDPTAREKLQEIAERIDQAVTKWGMQSRVALTGGEPFLSPELWPLLDFFQSKESTATLTILSNGTLITDEIASDVRNIQNYEKFKSPLMAQMHQLMMPFVELELLIKPSKA